MRERILLAAQSLFMEKGYIGTKTRQIARESSTSETSLFRHFDSKYTLLTAVYDRAWGALNAYVDAKLADHGAYDDPREELLAIISAFWTFYDDDPKTSAILIINTGNTDSLLVEKQNEATISDANIAYLDRIERLCERAATLHPEIGLAPRILAEGIYGIAEGVLLGWYLHDRAPEGRYPDKITLEAGQALLKKLLY